MVVESPAQKPNSLAARERLSGVTNLRADASVLSIA